MIISIKHQVIAWVLGVILILFVWWLVAAVLAPSDQREPALPGPVTVGRTLAAAPGVFARLTWQTGLQAWVGLLIAGVICWALVVIIGAYEIMEPLSYPYLVMLKASPAVAYVPLFMTFVGSGPWCKILVASMISFFPLAVGGLDGLHATPDRLKLLAEGFGASRWQTFATVRAGYALNGFLSGLKTSAPLAVVGSIVGEYVAGGRPTGLGSYIMRNVASDLMANVFAGVVMATLLGLLFFGIAYVLWGFGLRALHLAR